jgi:hypothetical protein
MPPLPLLRTIALSLTASCLIALVTMGGTAAAAEFGELTRFGEGSTGTAPGTLIEPLEVRTGQFIGARAVGVDPAEENTVFVVDEPKLPKQEETKEAPDLEEEQEPCKPGFTEVDNNEGEPEECFQLHGPVERFFRLQKFKANSKGEYALAASAEFSEKLPDFEVEPFNDPQLGRAEQTIEGIAVDPKRERVYMLAVDERRHLPDSLRAKFEHFGEGETEGHILEASTLYAFSTKESGTALEPAGQGGTPVLTGRSEIGAESTEAGKALLEPAGITVAPKTGDIVVLAHIDEKGEAKDQIHNPFDHYVLQRIGPEGKLQERYVDETNFLKHNFSDDLIKPNSPAAIENTTGEHIFLNDGELVQIPDNFTEKVAPSTFAKFPNENGVAHVVDNSETGGMLAGSPTGTTLYATAKVIKESKNEEEQAGVMELSAETGAEIGWTGGQELKGSSAECVVEPYNVGFTDPKPQVAAGSESKIFVLAPEFLLREEDEQPISPPFHPALIEFGKGGKGCAGASVNSEGIVAEVGGVKQEENALVSPTKLVTLSSTLKQADSLSVEWKYLNTTNGEETHETVTTDQLQKPETSHVFHEGGEFEISEKIHTDDLATPEVAPKGTRKLHLEGPSITKQPVSQEASEGSNAIFEAKASGSATVQWFVSPDEGKEFQKLTGATSTTLTVEKVTSVQNADEYRAVFSEGGFEATTKAATLSVSSGPKAPEVIVQPQGQSVTEGAKATFEARASGSPVPTVQWEVSTDGGAHFNPDVADPGNTSDTLTVEKATLGENGFEYRATFTNTIGKAVHSATSNAATLTVGKPPPPAVSASPANVSVAEGLNATFEAAASGATSVQWEISTNDGATFKADTADGGNTTDKLTVAKVTTSESGYEYRANFTNAQGSTASGHATLTVTTSGGGGGGGGNNGGGNNGGGGGGGNPGVVSVLPLKEAFSPPPPVPDAEIAGASIPVSSSGVLVLKVSCPAGESDCIGTVTLRTLTAVRASAAGKKGKKSKPAILTLASGSFAVAGGQVKSITLHLSSAARGLLASSHVLKARATVAAHDPAGASHTAQATLTLRLVAPKKKSGKH